MRGTHAIIHLENLAHNLSELSRIIGGNTRICLPVKADAYGHGAAAIARRALECGISFLAVSTVDEGAELRAAGIEAPILLLSIPSKSELESLALLHLSPFVSEKSFILSLENAASKADTILPVHIKVETGMQRTGCPPSEVADIARLIESLPHLFLEGIATHLAAADSLLKEDVAFTNSQLSLFDTALSLVRAEGINPGIVHAANSAGAIAYPQARLDMIRAGIAAYGYAPSKALESVLSLKPVMEFCSEVSFIKRIPAGASVSYGRQWKAPCECTIATLPVGYADGLYRSLSDNLFVEILKTACPVRGRICMDQLMVEVPKSIEEQVRPGMPATLFGPAPCLYSAADIAALAGTIPYEITCGISGRVPRVFRA